MIEDVCVFCARLQSLQAAGSEWKLWRHIRDRLLCSFSNYVFFKSLYLSSFTIKYDFLDLKIYVLNSLTTYLDFMSQLKRDQKIV